MEKEIKEFNLLVHAVMLAGAVTNVSKKQHSDHIKNHLMQSLIDINSIELEKHAKLAALAKQTVLSAISYVSKGKLSDKHRTYQNGMKAKKEIGRLKREEVSEYGENIYT